MWKSLYYMHDLRYGDVHQYYIDIIKMRVILTLYSSPSALSLIHSIGYNNIHMLLMTYTSIIYSLTK